MGAVYAAVSDITATGFALTTAQETAAEVLLETASARLRLVAYRRGKDIDEMIADADTGEDYALVVKSVVVQAVCRALTSIGDTSPAASQMSQTALGYSVSMTYVNAGQALYFLRSELRELGLLRQGYGALEVYAPYADDD